MPENIDLATENGEVVDLQSKLKDYAKKFLEPRCSYILLKVVGNCGHLARYLDETTEDLQQAYVPLIEQVVGEKLKLTATKRGRKVVENNESTGSSANSGTMDKGPSSSKPKQGASSSSKNENSNARAARSRPTGRK